MANTYTFKEAQDAVYQRLKQSPSTAANNQVYPLDQVKQWIVDAHAEILNTRSYPFMNKDIYFYSNTDTTITADANIGDTTLEVGDETLLYASGSIVINDDVISYTGVAANQLTGVTGIMAKHDSGDKVKQLYSIPTDLSVDNFSKPVLLTIDNRNIDYYDWSGVKNENGFTVHDDHLYLPDSGDNKRVILKYKKSIKTISADTDTFDIPDDYKTAMVEFALYKCHFDIDDTRAQQSLSEYNRIHEAMRSDFAELFENRVKNVRFAHKRCFRRNYY